jgi:hypothetical protein
MLSKIARRKLILNKSECPPFFMGVFRAMAASLALMCTIEEARGWTNAEQASAAG